MSEVPLYAIAGCSRNLFETRCVDSGRAPLTTGVPCSKETASHYHGTVGLCLVPYGDARGVGVSYERDTHVPGYLAQEEPRPL
jgi:hypothetical protein